MRKRRVYVEADGTIHFDRVVRGQPPVDESWWKDVLSEPKLRPPQRRDIPERSAASRYRVDRYPGTHILAACECGHRCSPIDRALVEAEFGGQSNTVWLVRKLSGCKHRNKVTNLCQALPVMP